MGTLSCVEWLGWGLFGRFGWDGALSIQQTQLHDLAARFARGLLSNFLTLQSEGAGNAGCTLHPRSRVQ
jgi:hypothetical protein